MSWAIVGAVLVGALLHASWNAIIKAGGDKALDTGLVHSLGCIAGLALVAVVGLPDRAAWPWIAASMAIHVGYYITLVGAYQHGDLGFAYPIMRGSAPLLVALASSRLIGESLSPSAWLGVAGISGGVLLIGLARAGGLRRAGAGRGDTGEGDGGDPEGDARRTTQRRALAFALANAVIIAAYTIVDGIGVRASGNALAYVGALFLFDGLPFLGLVLWRRRHALPAAFAYMRRRAPVAALGSLASMASYGVALWAMTRAPVATIAALRETSVLFAALIGVAFLGERFRLQRALGTGAIVAGVMALRLG